MPYLYISKALVSFTLLVATVLHAAEADLNGEWVDERGQAATLVQDGGKVLEISRDPTFTAFFGEHSFIATLSGTSLRGKVATALKPEFKEFCGKNWGNWADLEMELSSDGNRLEGRWKRGTQSTSEAGCPLTDVVWAPYVLTRSGPAQPSSPTKSPLLAGLLLLVLAFTFFFIRGAFENYLVRSKKRSPNTASLAGWALFGGLLSGSAIGSAALMGSAYVVLPVIISLAVLSMIFFVMCVIFSSKK